MRILLSYAYKPYTTAVYYERAFKALGHEVTRCAPDESSWVASDLQLDLFVWIEAGGGIHPLLVPPNVRTCALYIDSHTQRTWHIPDAKRYDHVFVSDIRYVGEYGPNAHWLPMACDPVLHTPTRTGPPEYDVAFVGNTYPGSPLYEDRRQALEVLRKRYKCNFWSNVYFQDMANVYASARVAFNKSVMGDLNMRVFEAACSGRAVVTDDVEPLDMMGAPGARFHSDYEMHDIISELVTYPHLAVEYGAVWRQWVLAHHTYAHRAAQMLQEAGL